jgi:hypothetical protein
MVMPTTKKNTATSTDHHLKTILTMQKNQDRAAKAIHYLQQKNEDLSYRNNQILNYLIEHENASSRVTHDLLSKTVLIKELKQSDAQNKILIKSLENQVAELLEAGKAQSAPSYYSPRFNLSNRVCNPNAIFNTGSDNKLKALATFNKICKKAKEVEEKHSIAPPTI